MPPQNSPKPAESHEINKEIAHAMASAAFRSVSPESDRNKLHQAEIRQSFEVKVTDDSSKKGGKLVKFNDHEKKDEYLVKYAFEGDKLLIAILTATAKVARSNESVVFCWYAYGQGNSGALFCLPATRIVEILVLCAETSGIDPRFTAEIVEEAILEYKRLLCRDTSALHRKDAIEVVHAAWDAHKEKQNTGRKHDEFKKTADAERKKLEEALRKIEGESKTDGMVLELLGSWKKDFVTSGTFAHVTKKELEAKQSYKAATRNDKKTMMIKWAKDQMIIAQAEGRKLDTTDFFAAATDDEKISIKEEWRFMAAIQKCDLADEKQFEKLSPEDKRKVLKAVRDRMLMVTHPKSTDNLTGTMTRLFVLEPLEAFAKKHQVNLK